KCSLHRMDTLLRDPARSQFVPVTIAEPLGVHVTLSLCKDLATRKIPVSDLIVNRLHFESDCLACATAGSVEHTSGLQLLTNLVCRLLLEKKKNKLTDRLLEYTEISVGAVGSSATTR